MRDSRGTSSLRRVEEFADGKRGVEELDDNCFLRLDSSRHEMVHFKDLFIHPEVDHSVRKEEP